MKHVALGVKRGIGRTTRRHPALELLHRKGVTVTELSRWLREPRSTVSNWFGSGAANRPIPQHHAERIRGRYGVPLDAWERVRDYPRAA